MEGFDNIPAELVSHVTAGCGERGVAWLGGLPGAIASLERDWSIRIGDPFPAIEYNYVAPAVTAAGEEVVIKIHPPWEPTEIFDEAAFLRQLTGKTCVRLLAVSHQHKAIMIERLRPGLSLAEVFEFDPSRAIGPAISVLNEIVMPVERAPVAAPRLSDWVRNFERWRETDFPARYAERAQAIYTDLAGAGPEMYIHGDFHPGNVLNSDRAAFLAIDPKGIIGYVGYDVAVFMLNLFRWVEKRDDAAAVLDNAVSEFARGLGITEREVREWTYFHTVIGSWWNYAEMPDLYDGSVVIADIWDV